MIRPMQPDHLTIDAVRESARAKAVAHIIPDYAERFPDQFEHAVEEIARHEMRAMKIVEKS